MAGPWSPQHQIRLWRGIIDLNNTAVSLMVEHHCYQQAQAILKDTVSLLKHSFGSVGNPSEPPIGRPFSQAPGDAGAVAGPQHKRSCPALDCLVILEGAQKRARQMVSNPARFQGPRISFLAVGDDDEGATDVLDARNVVFRLILISQPDDLIATSGVDGSQDRFMAVVSYNYALTFLCNARLAHFSPRAVKLQEIAVKILRVAANFVASAVCGHRDDDYPERTLAVTVLALHAWVTELQRLSGLRGSRHHHHDQLRREITRGIQSLRLAARHLEALRMLQRACTSSSSFIVAPAA